MASQKLSEVPRRPTKLNTQATAKKRQSLPIIKTPLDELRLVPSEDACMMSISESHQDEYDEFSNVPDSKYPLQKSSSYSNSERDFGNLRPKSHSVFFMGQDRPKPKQVARLTNMMKCPSSSSLNRPLNVALERLERQTSCFSTGSLKSLSFGSSDSITLSGGSNESPGVSLPSISDKANSTTSNQNSSCKGEVSKPVPHEVKRAISLPESTESSSILPQISTKEARLKSFLVGNVQGKGSLLGEDELNRYFPERKVTVYVATWNMNGLAPPVCLDDLLLPENISHVPDIYAVGIQEGWQDKKEWEIMLQFTLGPSHVLFHSASLGVLHLAILIRRDLIWFCSVPEDATHSTRPGSAVKTKGAVAIAFQFFGSSFLFINSHLTAHEKKYKERISDYEKICHTLDLPKQLRLKLQYQSKDVTARFDVVFWCGDLNFRLSQDRAVVLKMLDENRNNAVLSAEELLKYDQLKKAMSDGGAFFGFQECKITFQPSYKYEPGSNSFDNLKMRVPSYTDRVLFRSKRKGHTECKVYKSIPAMQTSDHKPVYGVYEVKIKPGRDNVSLAAGLFNRDVYMEAIKRRSAALEIRRSLKASQVCLVM